MTITNILPPSLDSISCRREYGELYVDEDEVVTASNKVACNDRGCKAGDTGNKFDTDDDKECICYENGSSEDYVLNRLRHIKSKIQRITKEAYQQLNVSNPNFSSVGHDDIMKVLERNDAPNSNCALVKSKGNDKISKSILNSTNNNDKEYDASFQLGLVLFGQSVTVLEETLQERLQKMETELNSIIDSLQDDSQSVSSSDSIGPRLSTQRSGFLSNSKEQLQNESYRLRHQLEFLKQCSISKFNVDQAISISNPALTSSSVIKAIEPDYVLASRYIQDAILAMVKANEILHKEVRHPSSSICIGSDELENMNPGTKAVSKLDAAYTMIHSIQSSIRRQKLQLLGIAKNLWIQCISVTSDSIIVKGKSHGLAIAYQILEVFSMDNGISLKDSLDLDEASGSDRYDQTDDDPTSFSLRNGTPLTDILQKLAYVLKTEVFQPIFQKHETSDGALRHPWTFMEHVENDNASANNTMGPSQQVSMSKGNMVAALSKGPIYHLEWSHHITSSESYDDKRIVSDGSIANIKKWSHTFEFVQRILHFVVQHILLERPSLCHFMAFRFFGKPCNLRLNNAINLLTNESSLLHDLDDSAMFRFGDDDNGMLLQPLLEALEATCVPSYLDPIGIEQLKSTSLTFHGDILTFVQVLDQNHIISNDGKQLLLSVSKKMEQLYVTNRRCHLINHARDLIMNTDYHNTIVVGEDVTPPLDIQKFSPLLSNDHDGMDVFKLDKAAISTTVLELMKLCCATMNEAVDFFHFCDGGTDCFVVEDVAKSGLSLLSPTLYKVSRDMLDLFRSMIPVRYGYEIASVPRTAAVLHNDCVYLAYHCLTLGLEYQGKFPLQQHSKGSELGIDPANRGSFLHQTCMFIDMVPIFRDIADRTMGDMLEMQARHIIELLNDKIQFVGQSLVSDEVVVSEWSDAENGIQLTLYHFRQLCNTWKPLLSYSVYSRCVCYLADVIFTLLLSQVIRPNIDISSSGCQFIHKLFRNVKNDIELTIVGSETKNSHTTASSTHYVMKTFSKLFNRFDAVTQFMDMSLMDVQNALANGVFVTVTAQEMTQLITSCFDDSPKRSRLLQFVSSFNMNKNGTSTFG